MTFAEFTIGVAPQAITGKQRFAAEQGVAGPFEVMIVRQAADFESGGRQPGRIALFFPLSLRMAKP